jgi:hypothetical protein
MRPTHRFCLPLLALAGLLAGSANGMSFDGYDVTGLRHLGVFADGAVEGSVGFDPVGSDFEASFADARGLGVSPSGFSGTYTELNLLFISLWSFQGTSVGLADPADGTGIRLFFGLLVFGSLHSNGYTIDFSGVFAGSTRGSAGALLEPSAATRVRPASVPGPRDDRPRPSGRAEEEAIADP